MERPCAFEANAQRLRGMDLLMQVKERLVGISIFPVQCSEVQETGKKLAIVEQWQTRRLYTS
jgi:hypothetical protein